MKKASMGDRQAFNTIRLNKRSVGTINFKVKDGFMPNLPNLPHDLVQVFYSGHALEAMKLPSRGYDGEVLSKFPTRCKSITGLHPYELKKIMGDEYNKLEWEYDEFPLYKMAIRSYRTVNDKSDGEVESALFVDQWSKKWFCMAVRLNLGSYYEATTIHPTSWKESRKDKERWERFLP